MAKIIAIIFLFLIVLLFEVNAKFWITEKVEKLGGERIVGGDPVKIEDFNFITSLQVSFKWMGATYLFHICGAVIINPYTLLTAAHCVDGQNPNSLKICAGSANLENFQQIIQVSEIVIHQNYSSSNLFNDIAIIKLVQSLTFNENVSSIELADPKVENFDDGSAATVLGWGYQSEYGSVSNDLRAVTVNIISNYQCSLNYFYETITDDMICAGTPEGGKDSCQGDSGGPLVWKNSNNDYQLIGIVSWGYGCARPNLPGVYTLVSSFADWIKSLN